MPVRRRISASAGRDIRTYAHTHICTSAHRRIGASAQQTRQATHHGVAAIARCRATAERARRSAMAMATARCQPSRALLPSIARAWPRMRMQRGHV
ncbi:hypothetical protein DIJ60_29590 [Burkholderia pseudomallei]|nr:hypothetical protein DIJ60_29590 [Burkholderia pseudomallei]